MVGRVVRAHGVRGALRVHATGATLAALPVGSELRGTRPDGGDAVMRIAATLESGIMRFEGIDDRDAAASAVGTVLSVPADRLPEVDGPDTFYVRDLIGCRVLIGDRDVGEVRDVLERPANDVLEVLGPGGEDRLLPFTHDAIIEVDLAGRIVRVRDGLLADEDDA